jgi:outer membrane protein OmpA-like peptidoglycan-associated protein
VLDPCHRDTYDEDACPDPKIVIDSDTEVLILQEVHFEFDSAVIKPESFGILRAVARALDANQNVFLVEVQGHTDQRGSDRYNLDLSQRRAESVVEFLVKEGITRSRLQPKGYGKRRPVDKRMNEEAWAKNRRVEFVILERW